MLKRLTALILAEMLLLTCMAVAEDEPDTQNEEAPADAAVTEKTAGILPLKASSPETIRGMNTSWKMKKRASGSMPPKTCRSG